MLALVTFVAANILPIIGGLCTVLSGLIAIALVIPGEQPDKALQSALDFLLKFSKK